MVAAAILDFGKYQIE